MSKNPSSKDLVNVIRCAEEKFKKEIAEEDMRAWNYSMLLIHQMGADNLENLIDSDEPIWLARFKLHIDHMDLVRKTIEENKLGLVKPTKEIEAHFQKGLLKVFAQRVQGGALNAQPV